MPYTPDSGTIAIRCGKLSTAYSRHRAGRRAGASFATAASRSVTPGASRGDATRTHVPVLDLSDYTCLPGLIDMHTHLTDRPEDTADLHRVFLAHRRRDAAPVARKTPRPPC